MASSRRTAIDDDRTSNSERGGCDRQLPLQPSKPVLWCFADEPGSSSDSDHTGSGYAACWRFTEGSAISRCPAAGDSNSTFNTIAAAKT
jgi:hypothetical protein